MNTHSAHPLASDAAYTRLKESLIAWTGLAYYADKDRELAERIKSRLEKTRVPDCAAYAALLNDDLAGQIELDALIADLTIGETFFFRHPEMFDAIRTIVLPDLIARNQYCRRLRIWSAGCATGAEPYSVSILIKRDMAQQLAGWDVSIIGTDINREFLARRRDGAFDEWALRSNNEEVKNSCFTRKGNALRIKPEFKDGVSFQYHNLVTHPSPSLLNNLLAFDIILCRNVTIYFSCEIIRGLIAHFHRSLVEGGWLLVGHAEPNIELFQAFRTVNAPGAVLYQKKAATGNEVDGGPRPPVADHAKTVWPLVLPERQESSDREPTIGRSETMSRPREATASDSSVASSGASSLDAIRALADRGEWVKTAARCRELLQEDQLNTTAHFYEGLVLEQLGQHQGAERALRRVIYLDRSFVLGHYYLGLLLQKSGKRAQSALSFQNVRKLLTRIDPEHVFVDGDGIRACELRKLTEMHLQVLEEP